MTTTAVAKFLCASTDRRLFSSLSWWAAWCCCVRKHASFLTAAPSAFRSLFFLSISLPSFFHLAGGMAARRIKRSDAIGRAFQQLAAGGVHRRKKRPRSSPPSGRPSDEASVCLRLNLVCGFFCAHAPQWAPSFRHRRLRLAALWHRRVWRAKEDERSNVSSLSVLSKCHSYPLFGLNDSIEDADLVDYTFLVWLLACLPLTPQPVPV